MSKFSWVVAIVILAFGWTGALRAEDTGKPLVIGMELNYPPFEMTNPSGTPTGVGVDMAWALCAYLHRPIDIQNMPFEGAHSGAEDGTDRPDHFVDDSDRRTEQVDRLF